ncbi:hypothetical protein IWX90DRAFT_416000 [Phyllosticta citrichinensis]|uniref:Uncharacterized protein n=1 Tax=Phyllosticta citrichinensis TaxID=1130410 RepID=A0ABR1XRC5_9PEZI
MGAATLSCVTIPMSTLESAHLKLLHQLSTEHQLDKCLLGETASLHRRLVGEESNSTVVKKERRLPTINCPPNTSLPKKGQHWLDRLPATKRKTRNRMGTRISQLLAPLSQRIPCIPVCRNKAIPSFAARAKLRKTNLWLCCLARLSFALPTSQHPTFRFGRARASKQAAPQPGVPLPNPPTPARLLRTPMDRAGPAAPGRAPTERGNTVSIYRSLIPAFGRRIGMIATLVVAPPPPPPEEVKKKLRYVDHLISGKS